MRNFLRQKLNNATRHFRRACWNETKYYFCRHCCVDTWKCSGRRCSLLFKQETVVYWKVLFQLLYCLVCTYANVQDVISPISILALYGSAMMTQCFSITSLLYTKTSSWKNAFNPSMPIKWVDIRCFDKPVEWCSALMVRPFVENRTALVCYRNVSPRVTWVPCLKSQLRKAVVRSYPVWRTLLRYHFDVRISPASLRQITLFVLDWNVKEHVPRNRSRDRQSAVWCIISITTFKQWESKDSSRIGPNFEEASQSGEAS